MTCLWAPVELETDRQTDTHTHTQKCSKVNIFKCVTYCVNLRLLLSIDLALKVNFIQGWPGWCSNERSEVRSQVYLSPDRHWFNQWNKQILQLITDYIAHYVAQIVHCINLQWSLIQESSTIIFWRFLRSWSRWVWISRPGCRDSSQKPGKLL